MTTGNETRTHTHTTNNVLVVATAVKKRVTAVDVQRAVMWSVVTISLYYTYTIQIIYDAQYKHAAVVGVCAHEPRIIIIIIIIIIVT